MYFGKVPSLGFVSNNFSHVVLMDLIWKVWNPSNLWGGISILSHIRDVRPEWVSFRGPKTCRWVYISAQKPVDGS